MTTLTRFPQTLAECKKGYSDASNVQKAHLERVADLAADIREGDVEAGHDDGL